MNSGAVPSVLIADEQLSALTAEGWFLLDGVLGLERARAARSAARDLRPAMHPAATGRGRGRRTDSGQRGDVTLWLEAADAEPGLVPTSSLFERLRTEANAKAWLGLDSLELQLACYPGGGAAYQRHRDAFRDEGDARRLTAIYYLNEDWQRAQGGCLRLFLPGGDRDIEPVADRLLVFLSAEIEHEVLPALAERWALTAWFSGSRRLPAA